MTTLMEAKQRNTWAWRPRDAAGWIGLAASPTFAVMAWIAATDAPRIAFCACGFGHAADGAWPGCTC